MNIHEGQTIALVGESGSGKSTVFKVLQKIQEFVNGDSQLEKIFLSSDCTRWQTLQVQRFELEIIGNNGIYKYELGIGHDQDKCRVEYERLWYDNQLLLKFELGEVQLYRDNYAEYVQHPNPLVAAKSFRQTLKNL